MKTAFFPMMVRLVRLGCITAVWATTLAACGGDGPPKTVPPPPRQDSGNDNEDASTDANVEPGTGEDITEWLEPQRVALDAPALAAAVFDEDGMLASGATGVRKVGTGALVGLSDRWHLGTCTTALTATLVAVLVEDNIIDWDDTLADLFPEEVDNMKPAYKAVTLDMLLAHRGGFGEQVPSGVWAAVGDTAKLDDQRAIIASEMLKRDPDVAPNTAYKYSNVGYIIAAAALERKAGASWEDLIQFRVFSPLGMASCGFGPPATPPGKVDQPWGHFRDNDDQLVSVAPTALADSPAAQNPASRVHCSLADWGAFARAHLRGAGGDGNIVSAESYLHMHTPFAGQQQRDGWNIGTPDWAGTPGTTYSQFGSNTTNVATVWVAPDLHRVFIVLSNYYDEDTSVDLPALVKSLAAGDYEN